MLISIVIPACNAENHISRCLESLCCQTFSDIEILVVDDGSTDRTGDLLDQWAERDSRIRPFRLEHRGVSAARNLGLDHIRGEWVCFVDADDLVAPSYVQRLYEIALRQDAQMSSCMFHTCDSYYIPESWQTGTPDSQRIDLDAQFHYWYPYSRNSACGVLYAASLVSDIRFDTDVHYGEDALFFARALKKSGAVACTQEQLYCYVQYPQSASHGAFSEKKYTEVIAWERICQEFSHYGFPFRSGCHSVYALRCYLLILMMDRYDTEQFRSLLRICRSQWRYVLFGRCETFFRLRYPLFCLMPRLYLHLYHRRHDARKKAAILTICGQNCGNRLQNYALQTTLEKLGYRTETLRREEGAGLRETLRHWLRPLLKFDQLSRFYAFDRQIHWSKHVVCPGCVTEGLVESYSRFVIGSDQIWNPDFVYITELDYLPMVPPEKKLSYAASFGISRIPEEKQAGTARLLNTIPSIMVREDSGAKIVKDLTGREAQVVLDPTLLLTGQEWERLMRKPRNLPKGPYALMYLLGDSDPEALTDRFSQERNLQIVDFFDPEIPSGPAEFLYLIRHADLVCTDSFHACVFSFLMRRPLVIFERVSKSGDMSSRLDTLCRMFGLSAHRYTDEHFCPEAIWTDTYETGHQALAQERERCLRLLEQALAGSES